MTESGAQELVLFFRKEESMGDSTFRTGDKVLVLRYSRLGRLPPGLNASEILVENGFPLLVFEYGAIREEQRRVVGALPRERFASPWARFFPSRVRPALIHIGMLFRLFARFVLGGRPRLIIAHGLSEQVAAYFCGLVFGVPYAVQVHEGYDKSEPFTPFNRLLFSLEGAALRKASFLLFPEETRAALYRSRYALNCPTFIVANAPRLRAKGEALNLRHQLGIPADSILMAYLGGLGPTNVLQEAVQALSGLPRLHFLLWGWGAEADLQALGDVAERNGVVDRVHFLGQIEGVERWPRLEGCDLGYCVYRPDTFRTRHQATASNKLMECLAAGLPVLTNSNDDFKRLVTSYQIGACVPDLTPGGIRDGLHALIYDELGLKRKAAQALEAHRTVFHYERQFAPVLEFLRAKFGPTAPAERPDRDKAPVSDEARAK